MTRFSLFFLGFLISTASEGQNLYRKPSVRIESAVKVRVDTIRLRDIASIKPGEKEFIALTDLIRDVEVRAAPAPATRSVLLGARILELIEQAGVPKDSFGYAIPKTIVVEREGRAITKDEVLKAVKSTVWENASLDIQPRSVEWQNDQIIPVGAVTQVTTVGLGSPNGGRFPLRVDVTVDERPAARFLATALVDDWREVPVPTRSLERGMLVSSDDIQLVRLNLFDQPADVVSSIDDIIGKRAKTRIAAGETVRRGALDIPPMIAKGGRVSIRYRSGALSATAVGTAIEDGFSGSKIRIRNDASKKVIEARVIDQETAEVIN